MPAAPSLGLLALLWASAVAIPVEPRHADPGVQTSLQAGGKRALKCQRVPPEVERRHKARCRARQSRLTLTAPTARP